ncbi:MAG: amidohydrolase family protein [Rhodocyclaceae bacterium]|nr:amidohydrolase family protein [Rhodocyclaceae bacterium]
MEYGGAANLMGVPAGRYDGHVHVFDLAQPMVDGRRYTPSRAALLGSLDVLLRAHGMDGALLVQPSFLGEDNAYLLQALAAARETSDLRYRGVAMTSPSTPAGTLQQLTDGGVVGMRLNLVGAPLPDIDSRPWRAHLQALSRMGWHVEVHLEGERLAAFLPALVAQVETVVVDHFGLPAPGWSDPDVALAPLLDTPPDRLMVKLSAPYRFAPDTPSAALAPAVAPLAARLARHLGPRRLLWGSDWPWTRFEAGRSYRETLSWESLWMPQSV